MAGSVDGFEAGINNRNLLAIDIDERFLGLAAQAGRKHVETVALAKFSLLFIHRSDGGRRSLSSNANRLKVRIIVLLHVLLLTLFVLYDILEVDAEHAACKSEVANLNCAVVIYEDVSRLKVPMDDFSVV